MKLRNKQSGEIKEFVLFDGKEMQSGLTLENLVQEWEDAPEGPIQVHIEGIQNVFMGECGRVYIDYATAKEAEKTVRKFKAWKRLKDKGLRFCGHDDRDRGQLGDIVIYAEMPTFEYDDDSTRDDLDLLFGGEE